MSWSFLILLIIFQHGFSEARVFFMVIKILEVILVIDLMTFIFAIIKEKIDLPMFRSHYHEDDDIKIRVDEGKFMKVRYRLYLDGEKKIKDKGGYLRIEDKSPRRIKIKKIVISYTSLFHFFYLRRSKKTDMHIDIYPLAKKCDLSVCYKVVEDDTSDKRGQDYSEIVGFHKADIGDDLRYVHIPLSAKKGEYMIKEGAAFSRHVYHYKMHDDTKEAIIDDLAKIEYLVKNFIIKDHETLYIEAEKNFKIKDIDGLIYLFDHYYTRYL